MKKKTLFFTIFFILYFLQSMGQKKTINILRTSEKIKIDAELNENIWKQCDVANNFIEHEPLNGRPENKNQKSEIKITYNDNAIYIAATLYDNKPDSILKEFSFRDGLNKNTDMFDIWINPYNDDYNWYLFGITAAGVQIDKKVSPIMENLYWDAVWKSAVKITEFGWVVEVEIPYSAIRIPNKEEQIWGINFGRYIRRTRQSLHWNFIDINISNYGIQNGELYGIKNIKSPVRMSLMPYSSIIYENFSKENSFDYNFGMDLKYGINESFTLDMTLVPDFGQVGFDRLVLNLSPFEIKYDEKRQFFTEGVELFQKQQNLFYSRRIGGTPLNYNFESTDSIISNPNEVQLLNATKISGRTSNGLGIGFFNASTLKSVADLEDENGNKYQIITNPYSNYNMLVLDQQLKNSSYISFINTNVFRKGNFQDANINALLYGFINKQNSYGINGEIIYSNIFTESNNNKGYATNLKFAKINGNLQFEIKNEIYSKTYDVNDMGFLSQNNFVKNTGFIKYQNFKPKNSFLNYKINVSFENQMRYKPFDFSSINFNTKFTSTFKNYTTINLSINFNPTKSYDFYESRNDNYFFIRPTQINGNYWISTDYRKKFAIDIGSGFSYANQWNYNRFSYRISPRIRLNDKISLKYVWSNEFKFNDRGYTTTLYDDSSPTDLTEIIFAKRNITMFTNVLEGSYILNNKMWFSLKLRHYWSKLINNKFYSLNENGSLDNTVFQDWQENNINFNTWNIDLTYTWRFAPGSELNFMWQNSLISETSIPINNFIENLQETLKSPQQNGLSLKLIYYLDYLYLKRDKNNKSL